MKTAFLLKMLNNQKTQHHTDNADKIGVEGKPENELDHIQINGHRLKVEDRKGFHEVGCKSTKRKSGDEFADYPADYRAKNKGKDNNPEISSRTASHITTSS